MTELVRLPRLLHQQPRHVPKNLWGEIGMLPETWDNVRIGGAKLKAKVIRSAYRSRAATIRICHGAGCCGAMAPPSRTKAARNLLDSKEAVEAVKFVAALYKEAMTQVLSWNDASNNQYIVSGVGSYIVNPISAYRTRRSSTRSSPMTSSS